MDAYSDDARKLAEYRGETKYDEPREDQQPLRCLSERVHVFVGERMRCQCGERERSPLRCGFCMTGRVLVQPTSVRHPDGSFALGGLAPAFVVCDDCRRYLRLHGFTVEVVG